MRLVLVATVILALAAGAGTGLIAGRLAITAGTTGHPVIRNGWHVARDWTSPATDVVTAALRRASRAQTDPVSLPLSELIVFTCERDADGRQFSGASNYILQLALQDVPPVDDFWSVAVVGADGIASMDDASSNISSRSTTLRRHRDGSFDVQISATPPDDPTANWLPAPSGAFQIVLRAYTPAASLREAPWQPPAVVRRESAA